MKNFIEKFKAFIKMITPWVKYGIKEYRELKAFIKVNKKK